MNRQLSKVCFLIESNYHFSVVYENELCQLRLGASADRRILHCDVTSGNTAVLPGISIGIVTIIEFGGVDSDCSACKDVLRKVS